MKKPKAMLQVRSLRDVVPPDHKEIVVRMPNCYGSSTRNAYAAYEECRSHLSWLNKPPYSVSIILVSQGLWKIDVRGTITSSHDIDIVGEYEVPR